jgi:hypothetical protein
MTEKLLRHIPTGVIWVSHPAWETRSDFEPYEPPVEVAAADAPVPEAPRKPRKPRAESVPEVVAVSDEALSQEASRGL